MDILYDARLVLLSVAVAILASYAALSLASRIALARRASLLAGRPAHAEPA